MTNEDKVAELVSGCVREVLKENHGDSEKAWQLALQKKLQADSSVKREVKLGHAMSFSSPDWRVFGQGRAVDFVIDGTPVELKVLKGGLPSWGMMSLLQQGLIWRAACDRCLLVAISLKRVQLQPAERAFLGRLATRGVQTLMVDPTGVHRFSIPDEARLRERRAHADADRGVLADELGKVASRADQTTSPGDLRKALTKHLLEECGWEVEPAPKEPPLFAPALRTGVFRKDGVTLSLQTTIVRPNDAGAADGKFQAGMALSQSVDGTIVIGLDQKKRKPNLDAERDGGPAFERFGMDLSRFCRELGIDWRLVPDPSQSGPALRWPLT